MTGPSAQPAVVHAAALSTSVALASARADLHTAVRADDEHRRRQYALSARDSAAAVLLDSASTRLEGDYARNYFNDADAMIAKAADRQSIAVQGEWP
jgi:hypothetical protein